MIIVGFTNLEQFPELHGLESQLHRLEAALKVTCYIVVHVCYSVLLGWQAVPDRIDDTLRITSLRFF